MSRPSDALLKWLRTKLDERGLKTATLAEKLGRGRAEVRKLLTGKEPLLVDDLLRLTELLELSPEELSLPADFEEAADDVEVEEPLHWKNQPRAVIEFAFDLGANFMFVVDTSKLADWGGPDAVAKQHPQGLPIQLDAAYHQYMEPTYEDDAFSVVLSFDKLYRCRFPWDAITRVIFLELYYEGDDGSDEPEEEEEPPKGRPTLRLVT